MDSPSPFHTFPSRAPVQIKSVVCAAVGEDRSNLVEEILQNLFSDMNPRQINFTCSLQVQNANSCLIAANIKNAAKSIISGNNKLQARIHTPWIQENGLATWKSARHTGIRQTQHYKESVKNLSLQLHSVSRLFISG